MRNFFIIVSDSHPSLVGPGKMSWCTFIIHQVINLDGGETAAKGEFTSLLKVIMIYLVIHRIWALLQSDWSRYSEKYQRYQLIYGRQQKQDGGRNAEKAYKPEKRKMFALKELFELQKMLC